MMRVRPNPALAAALAVVGAGSSPAPAPRAQPPDAAASITVTRPLRVIMAHRLRFGRPLGRGRALAVTLAVPAAPAGGADPAQAGGSAAGGSPAVVLIRGDPGRAYRVALPREIRTVSGRHPVRHLTIWSATLGDVTRTRIGQLDASGRDTLSIGGVLYAPFGLTGGPYAADVPLQIAYE